MNINMQKLIGYKIKTIDGEYGIVSDLLFSDEDSTIRYLVVDPQKWNPLSQKVLITPVSVYFINVSAAEVCLSITTEKLKAAPGVEEHETVSRHYESALYQYYGYGYYWMGADLWGMSSDPALLKSKLISETSGGAAEDIHLRSLAEVSGYLANTADGQQCHIKDFIFNSKTWQMNYAVIEADVGLLSTEQSLVKISAIHDYNWHQQSAELSITWAQVKANPHFTEELMNSDEFLAMLELSPTKSD